jgi:hypothetical protein
VRGVHYMNARHLKMLLALVRRLEDRVLYEIASVPQGLLSDFEDRAIVAVARGEREWRLHE